MPAINFSNHAKIIDEYYQIRSSKLIQSSSTETRYHTLNDASTEVQNLVHNPTNEGIKFTIVKMVLIEEVVMPNLTKSSYPKPDN